MQSPKQLAVSFGSQLLSNALGNIGGDNGFFSDIGRTFGRVFGGIGPSGPDPSPPPAGIDSPATLTNLSQTSALPQLPSFRSTQPVAMGTMMAPTTAFGGNLLGPVLGAGRSLLKNPGISGALTGIGGAMVSDVVTDMFGNTKKLIITRKLQRDVKKVFILSGGDLEFVADRSMKLFGKSLSEDQILAILFKTFSNQGPYVTKAAVRKTRATIRKMETLCDLKDRLCPPKRRAPARRRTMSAQTITQVK